MGNLTLPRRKIWTQQPQTVRVAAAWAAKKPVLLCNFGLTHLDLISGNGGHTNGVAPRGVTQHGVGRYSLATSGFNYPDIPFGGNAPISIVAFVAGYSAGQSGVVGQGTEIILRTNATNNGCEFVLNSFTTNDRVSVVGTSRPGGGLVLAGTYGPSGKLRAYANGAMAEVTPTGTYANVASVFDVISTAVGTYGSNVHAVAIFASELSQSDVASLVENPWQIFAPQSRQLFVPVGGGGGSVNANASGALSAVAVTAPSASASGSASATGALATITISSPTATASGGGSASASGSFAALSISPATATATATKSATASGAFAVVSLSAPTATASGTTAGGANATCTPAQITISHAIAIAIGSAVASGGYQSIGITAPTGSASVGNGNATASGAWAAISITAPTAYASSGFIRAPSGSGPTVIQPGSYRPSNTGGRRY